MRLASICLWFHRDDMLMVCTNFTWFIDGALVLDPLRVIIIVGSDLLVAWHCLDIFFGALEFKQRWKSFGGNKRQQCVIKRARYLYMTKFKAWNKDLKDVVTNSIFLLRWNR